MKWFHCHISSIYNLPSKIFGERNIAEWSEKILEFLLQTEETKKEKWLSISPLFNWFLSYSQVPVNFPTKLVQEFGILQVREKPNSQANDLQTQNILMLFKFLFFFWVIDWTFWVTFFLKIRACRWDRNDGLCDSIPNCSWNTFQT